MWLISEAKVVINKSLTWIWLKMAKSKVIILVKHFDGLPKLEDFSIIEENLRDLEIGEFLVEALFFSVDPYIRRRAAFQVKEGEQMIGSQVAR